MKEKSLRLEKMMTENREMVLLLVISLEILKISNIENRENASEGNLTENSFIPNSL